MSQNIDLEARRKDFKMVHIDQNLKNELRNSHFHMGHFKSNFNTAFQSQFQPRDENNDNKNNMVNPNTNKTFSHKMGSDKVTYNSETHMKYISPILNKNRLE